MVRWLWNGRKSSTAGESSAKGRGLEIGAGQGRGAIGNPVRVSSAQAHELQRSFGLPRWSGRLEEKHGVSLVLGVAHRCGAQRCMACGVAERAGQASDSVWVQW